MALIESVPNISEGRRGAVIDAAVAAVRTAGARLLDVHRDWDHNRSVFTLAGAPAQVTAAVHALADVAIEHIDLRVQDGVHPRVGAIDVVPFVPIDAISLEACAVIARQFAVALAARHDVPVFLYEAAASAPHRQRLEAIRRGGLPGLTGRLVDPLWQPDAGPSRPHPTAGVVVVGARPLLVAYNINLDTPRLDVAQAVARTIRESSGGFRSVKALGLPLAHRGIVQVSMNLTDFRVTSMRTVFDAVVHEAGRFGVAVRDSELVGLVPAAALTADEAREFGIRGFDSRQILEQRLAQA